MAAKKALINFYTSLVRKDQMKLEEVDPEYREEVKSAISVLEEAAKKTPEE